MCDSVCMYVHTVSMHLFVFAMWAVLSWHSFCETVSFKCTRLHLHTDYSVHSKQANTFIIEKI